MMGRRRQDREKLAEVRREIEEVRREGEKIEPVVRRLRRRARENHLAESVRAVLRSREA